MNELWLLADAQCLARRMWHIGESNPDETRTLYCVYEFFSYIIRLDRAYSPMGFILAWDAPPYFRAKMYPPYKANRAEIEGNWATQLHWIKAICKIAEIAQVEVDSYEADDVLMTMVEARNNTLIVTSDKDLLYLVHPLKSASVELLRWTKLEGTHRKRFHTHLDVKDFIGVWPSQLPEYKALAGDASDNIPGVTGIGHKKAVRLLNEYRCIEIIHASLDKLAKKNGRPFKFALQIAKQRDDIALFKELCTPQVISNFEMPQARPLNIKAISDGLKEMETLNDDNR